ncbi:response regulator [Melittangium boletus]|uniref:response regulator n=1 Tax=Melittangium boletus TaxID=83453 RepID=UPI0012FD91BA|nr:response regulator [Melittangium boletus]
MRLRWTLAGGLACALVALGFFFTFSTHLEARAWRELRVRTQDVARWVALSVESALERGDAVDGQRQVDVLAMVPDALFGVLSREDGTLLAAWHPERVPPAVWKEGGAVVSGMVLARRAVYTPAGVRGTLLVGLSTGVMERELQHLRGLAGLWSLVLWGLGVVALFGLGGPLMRPLERVTEAIERLSRNAPVPGESPEEPGRGEPERLAAALSRLEMGGREQVDVLDTLVGEAREHQERLHVQQGLLDARMRELRLLRDQLVVADRRTSVGTLLAGVAHEINNPLAYITANIQFSLREVQRLEQVGVDPQPEVHSEPGRGSTFTVILPAACSPGRDVAPGGLALARTQRARLLVVDDEPRVGISLRRALSREHEVTVASSAREALARMCQAEPFDVILCDLMMPEMNGMEFFQELERTHSAQAGSVLFLTGGAFTEETRAFLEEHSDRLLRKPMDMDVLRERLRRVIDGQRLAGSTRESGASREEPSNVDLLA